MARAHALLMTSAREGWGLVVTEANACGTPAIVYDVPGLRDAVINEETGLVVSPDPERLADGMRRLWLDRTLYRSVTNRARDWSRDFSFDKAAEIVRGEIARRVA
jgi:glycosyltransferase involved in cell wall biosynthesis